MNRKVSNGCRIMAMWTKLFQHVRPAILDTKLYACLPAKKASESLKCCCKNMVDEICGYEQQWCISTTLPMPL